MLRENNIWTKLIVGAMGIAFSGVIYYGVHNPREGRQRDPPAPTQVAEETAPNLDERVLKLASAHGYPAAQITKKEYPSQHCPKEKIYYHLLSELGPGLIRTHNLCCDKNRCKGNTSSNYDHMLF